MNRRGKSERNDSPEQRVFYHPKVVEHDIPRLNKREKDRIKTAIENKVAIDPVLYGSPLRGVYDQYWKLRVGDWRVVYTIKKNFIYILIITHHRDVYQVGKRRL